MNNIGFIYYSDLHDYPRSIDAYTTLCDRYPDNDNEVAAWYYLYKMHAANKDLANAEKYKSLILAKYPDSNQAKIIIDPDYFVKENNKGAEAEQLYTKTYEAYKNGQYQRVMMNTRKAREQFADDTLYMPRFEFLNAVSLGYVEVVDSMAYSLLRLIQTYPESSIKPFALDVLLAANDMYDLGLNIESARPKVDTVQEKEYPYTFNPRDEYYVVVICNNKVRINPLKIRIGDFNKNNFRINQLTVKNLMLNKQDALITVEKFENLTKAQDYHKAMFLSDYIFGGINNENYQVIEISVPNFPIFYEQKTSADKMQAIHDILREAAKVHSDAKGFFLLNMAGMEIKNKNLGFGVKDFGYGTLQEFMAAFPKLYEVKKSGNTVYYRCLTSEPKPKSPADKLQPIHDVLHEVAKAHKDLNDGGGFTDLTRAGQRAHEKNLSIQALNYSSWSKFVLSFPKLYEVKKVGTIVYYRCR